MTRVLLEERKVAICEFFDAVRQTVIRIPKTWIRPMNHSSLQRPSDRSRRASSARVSSFPFFTSASNCLSHALASNSLNQDRNCPRSDSGRSATAFSISFTVVMLQIYQSVVSRARRVCCIYPNATSPSRAQRQPVPCKIVFASFWGRGRYFIVYTHLRSTMRATAPRAHGAAPSKSGRSKETRKRLPIRVVNRILGIYECDRCDA
jgi:hypothetical protein